MRKLLSAALSLVLLAMAFSGCADVSPQAGDGEDNPNRIGGAEGYNVEWQEQARTVEYSYQYTNMTLKLPEDWESTILDSDPGESENNFGIEFWPKAEPSMTVRLLYHVNGIGLCGTGVTFEDILLENGLRATKCTEGMSDNHWFFLIYQGVPGAYAAECYAPKVMWDEYENIIMSILGNAEIGKNILSEAEAIETAEAVCTISYDSIRAYFDHTAGIWEIHFSTSDNTGEGQIIRIDAQGNRL